MRSAWIQHVSDTFKKLKRKNKEITRSGAMKEASETWPAKKKRLERQRKRALKKSKKDSHAGEEN